MGVNAIIPASGTQIQCVSLIQVSTKFTSLVCGEQRSCTEV